MRVRDIDKYSQVPDSLGIYSKWEKDLNLEEQTAQKRRFGILLAVTNSEAVMSARWWCFKTRAIKYVCAEPTLTVWNIVPV